MEIDQQFTGMNPGPVSEKKVIEVTFEARQMIRNVILSYIAKKPSRQRADRGFRIKAAWLVTAIDQIG